jgi:Chaperonin 10 Kd subunit
MPMPCSVGDKVLYGKYDGTAVKYDGKEHQFIRDSDILFVYDGEKMSPDSIKMIRDQILVEVRTSGTALLLHNNQFIVLLLF